MRNFIFIAVFLSHIFVFAQAENSIKIYREEPEKVFDLQHTKLKVSFDFAHRQMPAEAWITAKTHFYDQQFFKLDAKAMRIVDVRVNHTHADYNYDGKELIIDLGKTYHSDQTFEVYIKYIARPELVKQKGSSRIKQAKGLYFINPDGTETGKPTEIWTQGETEAASCWFPTIDAPNQKSTSEIYIRVPEKFTTLSNGILVSQTQNDDATRTDYWKMDLPHAPYLFFMGIGEYAIVKDHWKDKAVDYYVEKKYLPVAKDIFGLTPEMIQFFSGRFGVAFPWQKYSQMVARDFVSGAMENTTCTLHSESAYQEKGQLVDENRWEDVIAHELSHQWFGDYVTAESWSNITLNESFATYAAYLWRAYKYGKDHADAKMQAYRSSYISGKNDTKNLVRFHYKNREDVFDAVAYQKGAAILHMLRYQLGDKAFFAGLKNYLTKHAFQSAEAHDLRLAFEEVSGKDLNLFFNQWYYGSGHPKLYVSYTYNDLLNTLTMTIKQADKVFYFPMEIALYESGTKAVHRIVVSQKEQQFTFHYSQHPDLVLVNHNHVLLCELHDESKLWEQYIFQISNATHYEDRREAVLELAKHQADEKAFIALTKALNDPYYGIRIAALEKLDLSNRHLKRRSIKKIENLAVNDPKTSVQAAAIKTLGKLMDPVYKPLFIKASKALSFAVKRSSVEALYLIDKNAAITALKSFDLSTKEALSDLVTQLYIREQIKEEMPFIAKHLIGTLFDENFTKYYKKAFDNTFDWIASGNNREAIQNLVDDLVAKGKKYKKQQVDQMALHLLRKLVQKQTESSHKNKEALIVIAKKGMAALLD